MRKAFRLYRLFNLLSLDVAAGAVVCSIFFAHLFKTQLKLSGIVALALTVWIIYTADHLLDAQHVQHEASTERHKFHQNNFRILLAMVLVAIVVNAYQIFFIRRPVLVGGVVLALVIAAYLIAQRYLKYLKEFFAALLYSGGVLLVPVSMRVTPLTTMHVQLIAIFFITALLNLLLFSWFDHARDEQDNRQSFSTIFGENCTRKTILVLFILNTCLFISLSIAGDQLLSIATLVVMNVMLFFLMVRKSYFIVNDRYRLLGDAVFIVPLIYISSL